MTGRYSLSTENIIAAFTDAGFESARINIKNDARKGSSKGTKIEFVLPNGVRGIMHIKRLPDTKFARIGLIKKVVAGTARSCLKP